MISLKLKANKIRILRWFNNRRRYLGIQSSFNYSFNYSNEEVKKLEKLYEKHFNSQLTVENILEIAKENKIDELKVDSWFRKQRQSSRRKYQPVVNSRPYNALTSHHIYQTNPVSGSSANIYNQPVQNFINSNDHQFQPMSRMNNLLPQNIPNFTNQYLQMMPTQSYQQPGLNSDINQLQRNQVFSNANSPQNHTVPTQMSQNQNFG